MLRRLALGFAVGAACGWVLGLGGGPRPATRPPAADPGGTTVSAAAGTAPTS